MEGLASGAFLLTVAHGSQNVTFAAITMDD